MAKSKILKELVNEEISLNIALKRLIVLAADMNDNDLKEWAEKEINGYNTDDEVPEYRKICSHSFYYNGFPDKVGVGGSSPLISTKKNEWNSPLIFIISYRAMNRMNLGSPS